MQDIKVSWVQCLVDDLLERAAPSDEFAFLLQFATVLYGLVCGGKAYLNDLFENERSATVKQILAGNPHLTQLGNQTHYVTMEMDAKTLDALKLVADKLWFQQEHLYEHTSAAFHHMLKCVMEHQGHRYFFTPSSLARMMAQMLMPQDGEKVLDPTCGNGRLLISTFDHCNGSDLLGIDISPDFTALSFFNLYFSGKAKAELHTADFLKLAMQQRRPVDIVIANPPYNSGIDLTIQFINTIMETLKPEGRCAILVPEGFLTNTASSMVLAVRRKLLLEYSLDGVVALPMKIYKPYTISSSSLILLTKRPAQPKQTVFLSELPEYEGPDHDFSDSVYSAAADCIVSAWRSYMYSGRKDTGDEWYWVATAEQMLENECIFAAEPYRQSTYVRRTVKREMLGAQILEKQEMLDRLIAGYMGADK